MEGKFRINWADIVCEAKQRRKKQKLSQQILAKLAGVSTPTVSRFENYQQDIQLSSAFSILDMLGLLDERKLDFPNKEALYLPDRMVVVFWGQSGNEAIRCEITQEALSYRYHGEGQEALKTFKSSRFDIEHEARRKFLAEKLEDDGRILISAKDLM